MQCLLHTCLFAGRAPENSGGTLLRSIAPPRTATTIWWWNFSTSTPTSSLSSLPSAEFGASKQCGTTRNTSRTSRNVARRLRGASCWNARREEEPTLSFAPGTAGGSSTPPPLPVTWISSGSYWGGTLRLCWEKESME